MNPEIKILGLSRRRGGRSIDWRPSEPADLVLAARPTCDPCSWVWHNTAFKLKAANRQCSQHGNLPVLEDPGAARKDPGQAGELLGG